MSVAASAQERQRGTPSSEALTYRPSDRAAISVLGKMTLSATGATFEHLDGQVRLEYAGVLQELPADPSLSISISGGDVYRVIDGDEYGRKNYGACGLEPLTHIVTKFYYFLQNGGSVGGTVMLLTVNDYRELDLNKPHVCGIYSYDSMMSPTR